MPESKRKHFLKIIIPFSVVMVLITILFQASMYSYFVRTYSDALRDVEIDVLEQKSNNLAYLTENIKSLNNSIRLNYKVMGMCYESDMDIYDLVEAQTQFDTIRVSSDLIHSIYLVNKKAGEVHISCDQLNSLATYSNFQDQEIFQYIEDISSFGSYTPTARKIRMENGKEIPVLTFFLYDYFIQTKSIDGIIVINVPIDWLKKKIITDQVQKTVGKNDVMIVDEEGRIILDSGGRAFGTELGGQEYMKEILNRQENEVSLIRTIDGEKCLLSYYRYGNPEWTFVGIKSYSYMEDRLYPILNFTLLISLVVFAAGMLIICFLAGRLADNYNRISQNVKNLEAQNREHMQIGRAEFIRGLLRGNGIGEGTEEKFAGYGMSTRAEVGYYVVLFEIDRFTAFCKAYNLDERNRILGQAIQIIETEFGKICCCDVGKLSENQIIVLCNALEHTDIMRFSGNLSEAFDKVNQQTRELSMPGLSAAVSSIGYGYEALPELYDEVTNMIQYRYIMGLRTLLFPEMLPEKKQEEPAGGKRLDGEIISALGKGRGEEACEGLRQYLDRLGARSPYEIKLMVVNLLIQINNTMIDSSVPAVFEDFNINALIQEIMSSETMEETYQMVSEVFDEVVQVQKEKDKCKYDLLIQQIKEYIQKTYREDSLSINLIAEQVGLSIGYLGRLFKKVEGKSISEYIMEVRLKEAEELLKNSRISINTIATQVGFMNNSYFYSVFKKVHGVTPNQWRALEEEQDR